MKVITTLHISITVFPMTEFKFVTIKAMYFRDIKNVSAARFSIRLMRDKNKNVQQKKFQFQNLK
jgi:hypothetical protein